MTKKAITFGFVVPELLAVALGIIILISISYLTQKYPLPIVQPNTDDSVAGKRDSAELPNPDVRLSRVHLLLSGMK